MQPVEFAVWTILAVFTIFFFLNWLLKKRQYRNASVLDTRQKIAEQAALWVVTAWAAVLLVFLFISLNTFYLLVIFPLVYLAANYQVAKRLTKED